MVGLILLNLEQLGNISGVQKSLNSVKCRPPFPLNKNI